MAESELIAMENGTEVEFVGKKKMIKNTKIDDNGNIELMLEFRNGRIVNFVVPPALLDRFAAHGAEQKIGDEIAGLMDVDDCVIAVEELCDRLTKGEWRMKREGGSGLAGTSVLARALVK